MVFHGKTSNGCLSIPRRAGTCVVVEDRKTYPDIAGRLRKLRTAVSDLTRKDWAGRHGFNPTQYTNWENGARRIPIDASEVLCRTYGVTLDWIYLGRAGGLPADLLKLLS
jgi:transcriptional regulator with XRE-family HTH domain